jgi:hypothetical protein
MIIIQKDEGEEIIYHSKEKKQGRENFYGEVSYHSSNQWNLFKEYNHHSNQISQPLDASLTESITSNL